MKTVWVDFKTGKAAGCANAASVQSSETSSHMGVGSSQENTPLPSQLKCVDPAHGYLAIHRIGQTTAELFGAGFFSGKGLMSGRVVIPIHNERGELVAYAGRSIDDSEPQYKLSAGFDKSLELFNLHRAMAMEKRNRVVVVKDLLTCMNVHQAGYPCVALMGSSMSGRQEELLVGNFWAALLLLDRDETDTIAAGDCAARLIRRMFVKSGMLPATTQSGMLTAYELQLLIG